jgi:hypothetical protein
MICESCSAGADNADDYRAADADWRSRHPADHKAAGGGWLLKRLRWTLSFHRLCRGGTWCDCQHQIPELRK